MTPEQIETMRKIQRSTLTVDDHAALRALQSWAYRHTDCTFIGSPVLTEAGAEVLRLHEELAEARRERLQVGLRAGFDVGALEEERDTLRAALEEARLTLAADKATSTAA